MRKIDIHFSRAQRLLRLGINAERMAWETPGDLLEIPAGKDAPGTLARRLKEKPVLIPTVGWPEGTKIKAQTPPDWSWRIAALRDQRLENDRPAAVRLIPLAADVTGPFDAAKYRGLAVRHADLFEKMRGGRQIVINNHLALVHFKTENGILHAIQELFTIFPFQLSKRPDDPLPPSEAFNVCKAPLTGVPGEKKPVIGGQ